MKNLAYFTLGVIITFAAALTAADHIHDDNSPGYVSYLSHLEPTAERTSFIGVTAPIPVHKGQQKISFSTDPFNAFAKGVEGSASCTVILNAAPLEEGLIASGLYIVTHVETLPLDTKESASYQSTIQVAPTLKPDGHIWIKEVQCEGPQSGILRTRYLRLKCLGSNGQGKCQQWSATSQSPKAYQLSRTAFPIEQDFDYIFHIRGVDSGQYLSISHEASSP